MMRIDNRLFVPLASPFVMLTVLRLLWLLAGAEWDADAAAVASAVFGLIVGGCIMGFLFGEEIELGFIQIGRAPTDGGSE